MRQMMRLGARALRSSVSELRLPYKLTFAVTYRCQLRCGMCNIWRREPLQEMTGEEIESLFRAMPTFSWINLSGGEIFLRPDIDRIFDIITRTCPDLYLLNFPTNGQETEVIVRSIGSLTGEARIPKLMVTVSMDGPEEVHDRIRSTPGAWQKALETYRRLREVRSRRFEVYLGMTLQDGNAEAFESMLAAVRERIPGVTQRDIHVNVMHTSHYYGNSGCPGVRDRDGILHALDRIRIARGKAVGPVAFLERRFQSAADRYLRTGRSGIPCQALGASLFLDPAGTVYPCTMFDRPLGNLRDVDLELRRLWQGGSRQTLRDDIQKGKCPGCWTPCEAYQSILGDMMPGFRRK